MEDNNEKQNQEQEITLDQMVAGLKEERDRLQRETDLLNAKIIERDRVIHTLLNGNQSGKTENPSDDFFKKLKL